MNYPQMPPMTQDEIAAFLSEPQVVRICSQNEDGTIHVAPLWFKYDGGEILLGTQKVSRKVRNIERDPNVTIILDTPGPPPKCVIFYGTATLDYDDAVQKRIAIFEKYMPPEQAAGLAHNMAKDWEPAIIRIKPEKTVSFDYAKASLG